MRNQIITIVLSVIFSLVATQSVTTMRFGSTVISTDSSDTLETLRTNVNSSLTSLQSFASSTSLIGLMASTTPFGSVGIEQGTETNSLWIANQGSSTPSLVVLGVNGNGKVGIGTSTPFASFGLGTSVTATSSVSFNKLCFVANDPAGRTMFITLSTSGSQVFSTSTTSCL